MLQAAQDTFRGVCRQSRERFDEDLHLKKAALAKLFKDYFKNVKNITRSLAKRPQTAFAYRWETFPLKPKEYGPRKSFSTVKCLKCCCQVTFSEQVKGYS